MRWLQSTSFNENWIPVVFFFFLCFFSNLNADKNSNLFVSLENLLFLCVVYSVFCLIILNLVCTLVLEDK
jgi:hypothetical protein